MSAAESFYAHKMLGAKFDYGFTHTLNIVTHAEEAYI